VGVVLKWEGERNLQFAPAEWQRKDIESKNISWE
jgi:hypothetical protein